MLVSTVLPTMLILTAPLTEGVPQAAGDLRPSTIVQAVWLGLVTVFVFSVWASGFTAKRINTLTAASYAPKNLDIAIRFLVRYCNVLGPNADGHGRTNRRGFEGRREGDPVAVDFGRLRFPDRENAGTMSDRECFAVGGKNTGEYHAGVLRI